VTFYDRILIIIARVITIISARSITKNELRFLIVSVVVYPTIYSLADNESSVKSLKPTSLLMIVSTDMIWNFVRFTKDCKKYLALAGMLI
jgi:hypothetical protein